MNDLRFEKDPRLQLYTVATATLNRLKEDFEQSELGQTHRWADCFLLKSSHVSLVQFINENTDVQADQAECLGLYLKNENNITIPLRLLQDGSPYCREKDLETEADGGYYEVELLPDAPPVLLPVSLYAYQHQTSADLYSLSREHGSLLGEQRAQSLKTVIQSFAIEFMDRESVYP